MKVSEVKSSNEDKPLLGMGSSVPDGVVHPRALTPSMTDLLLEGRVHGGGLLALLSCGGNSGNVASDTMAWM
uniref:Uncharacterized protein n=1 Tax=Arundo donax TaxID=35708 RepID=A0A0A9JIQ9_ARUDO